MEPGAPPPTGFLGSLQGFADSLLAIARDRLRLFSIELQEEKLRLIQLLILVCAAIFAGFMAITFLSLTIVFAFWETARLQALGGITAFYALGLVALVIGIKRVLKAHPRPFEATLRGLKGDQTCIRPPN